MGPLTTITAAAIVLPATGSGRVPRAALALSTSDDAVQPTHAGDAVDLITARLLADGWSLATTVTDLDRPAPALPGEWGVTLDLSTGDPTRPDTAHARIHHPDGLLLADIEVTAPNPLWTPALVARGTLELLMGPMRVHTWGEADADPGALILAALDTGRLTTATSTHPAIHHGHDIEPAA